MTQKPQSKCWQRPENARHDVSTFVDAMEQAQRQRRRWMGKEVDARLMQEWESFLTETFEAAQDDSIVEMQKRSIISS